MDKQDKVKMRCFNCLNFVQACVHENGGISGSCPVCHAKFFVKRRSSKETQIKIFTNN